MVDGEPNSPTWKFTQCFGDKGDVEDITEADIISTVEFDHTGNYLATGDKGGTARLAWSSSAGVCHQRKLEYEHGDVRQAGTP